ncbi:hypothetical protein [Catellatospora sichuanensis]|uniref:hypothetical protein n=1 Tax=Catellatospora sichuanensis TaxID=1969805 RepID=UPI0011837CAA|nr:hypothetical protein [Catellatospora sichuanensis]
MSEYPLLIIAAVVIIALVVAAHEQVGPPRIRRFATRHGLDLTPERAASVERYLRLTRRHRAFTVFLGCAVPLIWLLPEQRFAIETMPVLVGWLLGASWAELAAGTATPAGEPMTVPAWLRRTPGIVAAVAPVSTALALWAGVGHPGEIVGWGIGALLTCVFVTATVQHVWRRRPLVDTDRAVDLAARAHATAAVTAVGLVLAVHCLLRQLDNVQAELGGQTALATATVGTVLGFGIMLIGVLIWLAAVPGRSTRLLAVTTALLLVFSAAWLGRTVLRDRPPYGPQELRPNATIRLTDRAHFDADAAALGLTGTVNTAAVEGERAFVGRIDVAAPPQVPEDSQYLIVVIDRRHNRAVYALYGGEGNGWGDPGDLPDRYDWLSALALGPAAQDGDFWAERPTAVHTRATGGPMRITFFGNVPDGAGLRSSHLLVALIFKGPRNQFHWAVQVPVSAA